ncbi:MAG: magnesium/cobalt transporter CorA [Candidatus Odinarchaeum yellowstonii]|uniref:Magnesium transport protein CorA n=1 Tax=Odinarchaeota yellowstonii (strain LCB_4) TaxID=1841599 RepID=A0AAF0D2F0_ODILC|nr:MAG: magnesium/cobalt transporter CorA [Candidatus Odinarchaeum yellowstonii]
MIKYNSKEFYERKISSLRELETDIKNVITWINIDTISDYNIINQIGELYGIHHLILEDITHTTQRPKIDVLENYIYLIAKMLQYNKDEEEIKVEQVSFILGKDYVISFQEDKGDVFNIIREAIRHSKGLIRGMGADFLLTSLIDAIVDNYFEICDILEEKIDRLDDEVLTNPSQKTINEINRLKREMIFIRKAVWPLREVVNVLLRIGTPFITQKTVIYLRDVYDHIIQIIDLIETLQEILSSMVDTYLSSLSNKTNEVMKILTIIATIFIPLTFIAGVYGMNFRYMPELEFIWGYPLVVIVMLIVSVIMLLHFRRKKWI